MNLKAIFSNLITAVKTLDNLMSKFFWLVIKSLGGVSSNLSSLSFKFFYFYTSYRDIFKQFFVVIAVVLAMLDLYILIRTGSSFIPFSDSYVYNILPESNILSESNINDGNSAAALTSSSSSSSSVGSLDSVGDTSRNGNGQGEDNSSTGHYTHPHTSNERLPTFNDWLTIHNNRLKSIDKNNFPVEYQNIGSDKSIIYGSKLAKVSQPSGLLERRGFKAMQAGIPGAERKTNLDFLKDARESEKLYLKQAKKFEGTIAKIDRGTEEFYPSSAKKLFTEYLDVLPHLRTFYTDIKVNLKAAIRRSNNN
jgi:hypothetical protein